MATKIEWVKNADGTQGETWNPLAGCSPVSAGCGRCYAQRMAARLQRLPLYEGTLTSTGHWSGKVNVGDGKLFSQPLRWKKPRNVFVCSMSDLFHRGFEDFHIARVFAVMALAQRHSFQVLTKRARRMAELLNDQHPETGEMNFAVQVHAWAEKIAAQRGIKFDPLPIFASLGQAIPWRWPLPNVCLMVSLENQKAVDERLNRLASIDWPTRGLSCEPLLGPLNLNLHERDGIDWTIVGAESGPGARPMKLDWARSIRDQAKAAGKAFFLKQANINGRLTKMPTLDGKVWDEMPRAVAAR